MANQNPSHDQITIISRYISISVPSIQSLKNVGLDSDFFPRTPMSAIVIPSQAGNWARCFLLRSPFWHWPKLQQAVPGSGQPEVSSIEVVPCVLNPTLDHGTCNFCKAKSHWIKHDQTDWQCVVARETCRLITQGLISGRQWHGLYMLPFCHWSWEEIAPLVVGCPFRFDPREITTKESCWKFALQKGSPEKYVFGNAWNWLIK